MPTHVEVDVNMICKIDESPDEWADPNTEDKSLVRRQKGRQAEKTRLVTAPAETV